LYTFLISACVHVTNTGYPKKMYTHYNTEY
jgi:hypothetical protein